jgi:hypothetical protein
VNGVVTGQGTLERFVRRVYTRAIGIAKERK